MKIHLIVKLTLIKEMKKLLQGCTHMTYKEIRREFQKMMELITKKLAGKKLSGCKMLL